VTHVMVATEPNAYRETIAAAIRSLRPGVEVTEVTPAETDWAVQALAPDLVLCSRFSPTVEKFAAAWVLLYADGSMETIVKMRGRKTIQHDIDFAQLLRVVDEAEACTSSA
jgi:hypothetical protein